MAQNNCRDFDKINPSAPIIQWGNRLRLMREHFINADPDIIGLVQTDSMTGQVGAISQCILESTAQMHGTPI